MLANIYLLSERHKYIGISIIKGTKMECVFNYTIIGYYVGRQYTDVVVF
jgi:hypothetical protein